MCPPCLLSGAVRQGVGVLREGSRERAAGKEGGGGGRSGAVSVEASSLCRGVSEVPGLSSASDLFVGRSEAQLVPLALLDS